MNDAQRCRRNGWKVGDVLQDTDGRRIRLTAIGEECVLAVQILRIWEESWEEWCGKGWETGWALDVVRWRRIGRWNKRTRKVEGT
jgi:hypothetical protein